jgi:acetyl-CoA carboxylase carboxyltransferase component
MGSQRSEVERKVKMTDQVKHIVNESVVDLFNRKERARLGGGINKIKRQHEAGFYTARERIAKLVDPDSFMELGMLNHSDMVGTEDKSAGDGIIVGLAKIDGRPAVVPLVIKRFLLGQKDLFIYEKQERFMNMP